MTHHRLYFLAIQKSTADPKQMSKITYDHLFVLLPKSFPMGYANERYSVIWML